VGSVSKHHFDNLPSPNSTLQGAEGSMADVTLSATVDVFKEEIELNIFSCPCLLSTFKHLWKS